MPTTFVSVLRQLIPVLVCSTLALILLWPSIAKAEKTFDSTVRMAYVAHPSLTIENGLTSGSLANLVECSMAYFSHIEFVEMPEYSLLTESLKNNVIDIGLNMVQTEQRDQLAQYAFDLYSSRVLLVGNEKSSNNKGAGVLGVIKGSNMENLMLAKGYQVNTKAYSIYRLIEMYRQGLINSFVESEVVVFDSLQALDNDGVDYDYQVLTEYKSGAYLSKNFLKNNPGVVDAWRKVSESCQHHAPKIDS